MSGMAASDASSIPLRVRVMAWWRGYDAAEYHAWQSGAVPERPSSRESLIPALPALSEFDHTQARVDVLQRLFGPGNAGPGGSEHAIEVVQAFGLTPVHTVLDLSAGLGGPATAIVQRFGVWITGYELDPELAEAAPAVVATLKGGDHVTVRGFVPDNLNLRPNSFDCVISRESMFCVRDRDALLKAHRDVMKGWGQALITASVLRTGAARGHACGGRSTGDGRGLGVAGAATAVVSTLKVGDHVPVRCFVPNNINRRPNSFDCVSSRESLFCVRDRDALRKEIRDVMKVWGQALITDYVLPTADPPSERIRSWLESEDLGFRPGPKQD